MILMNAIPFGGIGSRLVTVILRLWGHTELDTTEAT